MEHGTRDLERNNLRAFLLMIRYSEGTADENGYRALFGHKPSVPRLFQGFADHPRIRTYEKNDEFIKNGRLDFTTAAGAYQITETTWDRLCKHYPEMLPDFSPASQDTAGKLLIAGRGALLLVFKGRFGDAVHKCRREWASLPGANYGQPERKFDSLQDYYVQQGGILHA